MDIKAHLSGTHQGQFSKGMIMDFLDRAANHLIALERSKNTHTQIQNNRDKIADKQKRIEQQYNDI